MAVGKPCGEAEVGEGLSFVQLLVCGPVNDLAKAGCVFTQGSAGNGAEMMMGTEAGSTEASWALSAVSGSAHRPPG